MSESSPRILVAEDNPAMADLLQFSLQRAGYSVSLVSNGRKAIRAVKSEAFDVIITDFQMPGATGEEVIVAARTESLNMETPLVLCTAKGLELDTQRMNEQYRLAKVVLKPFSPRDIVELISSLNAVATDAG